MKIAVIEDDFHMLKEAFNYLNIVYFKNELEIVNYVKTQDVQPFSLIYEFDIILIDISLHRKSDNDGLSFLQRIVEGSAGSLPKIAIITGANNVQERMKELNITNIPIINKPVDFQDLKKFIQ